MTLKLKKPVRPSFRNTERKSLSQGQTLLDIVKMDKKSYEALDPNARQTLNRFTLVNHVWVDIERELTPDELTIKAKYEKDLNHYRELKAKIDAAKDALLAQASEQNPNLIIGKR